jgi:hypothetical protein
LQKSIGYICFSEEKYTQKVNFDAFSSIFEKIGILAQFKMNPMVNTQHISKATDDFTPVAL